MFYPYKSAAMLHAVTAGPVIQVKKQKSTGYKMLSKAGGRGEIYLYGVIGETIFFEGVSANQFAADLKALGPVTQLDIRINSEGGSVFDGRTIYSLLKAHAAHKTVYVDGLAASIASLIACAGDERKMAAGTYMMIHNPSGQIFGTADDHRRGADLLDDIANTMIDSYAAVANVPRADIKTMMDNETWLKAEDCKAKGFATEVTASEAVAACLLEPQAFHHIPDPLRRNRAKAATMLADITKLADRHK